MALTDKPEGGIEAPAWSDDGLLDQIDIALYAVASDGTCRRFNHAAERLFGYSEAEMLGQNMHRVLHGRRPDGSPFPEEDCPIVAATRGGTPMRDVNLVMWSRSGEALPVECSAARIVVDGQPGAVVTTKDLRPQHRAEASLHRLQDETTEILRQRDAASRMELELAAAESLRQREAALQVEMAAATRLHEQQELLDSVVQTTPVGIAVLDADLRFRWHNPAYGALLRSAGLRVPEAGAHFLEVFGDTPELREITGGVQRTGVPFLASSFRWEHVQSGPSYWNWSLKRLPDSGLLITMQNVTEQTLAQQALVEADKMAAVGRLAASISHEINNPLEAVTNLLYLLNQDAELSESSRAYVELAEEELSRVSRIASETLRFHRHALDAVDRTPKQLVDPVLALYAGKLKSSRVTVSLDYADDEPVRIYEGDVRQILNNLVGNAIDAMGHGGKLHVRTRMATCVRTGRRGMRISISDSGHGMSGETVAHIFEPFFTTKGAAGSGLGLWISHTLAKRHGGQLQVKSRPAGSVHSKASGTTFSLFLPSSTSSAGDAKLQ